MVRESSSFHRKCMIAKQVLRQVNFVLILILLILGRLQVPESSRICENAAGDMIR